MTASIPALDRPRVPISLLSWFFLLNLLFLLPAVVQAELVIFTDGTFLSVKTFEVEGERIRLDLRSGGVMVVPLLRVDRIVDDEIVYEEDRPPVVKVEKPSFNWRFDPAQPTPDSRYAVEILASAQKHGLNPALIAAVIRAESAFQSGAVSVKGARGLMQLMPATAERFGITADQAFEPALNIDVGSRYLRWLLERFNGRLSWALAGYNAGEGTVDRYGGVPPYRETRGYIQRIFRFLGLPDEGTEAAE